MTPSGFTAAMGRRARTAPDGGDAGGGNRWKNTLSLSLLPCCRFFKMVTNYVVKCFFSCGVEILGPLTRFSGAERERERGRGSRRQISRVFGRVILADWPICSNSHRRRE